MRAPCQRLHHGFSLMTFSNWLMGRLNFSPLSSKGSDVKQSNGPRHQLLRGGVLRFLLGVSFPHPGELCCHRTRNRKQIHNRKRKLPLSGLPSSPRCVFVFVRSERERVTSRRPITNCRIPGKSRISAASRYRPLGGSHVVGMSLWR